MTASLVSYSQIVTLSPSDASGDDEVALIFDATQGDGNLVGEEKVYIHSGVVTDSPDGTEWDYVIGNWGMDDGIGKMAKTATDEFTLIKDIDDHWGTHGGMPAYGHPVAVYRHGPRRPPHFRA